MFTTGRTQLFKGLQEQLVLPGERNGSRYPKSSQGAPGPTPDRVQLS